jgi:hypothetical protein
MRLYFGGAEIPSHLKLLKECDVEDVYLSYVGLRRRIKGMDKWLISEKIQGVNVFLESGAYTYNQEKAAEEDIDLADVAAGYMAFVQANMDAVSAFTEFDALPLGLDWIKNQREDFYDDLGEKFVPVWHPGYGVEELEAMAARYHRIGITTTTLGTRDLVPVLNMLVQRRGTLFHGLAMTKPDTMQAIKWDSVGSTSWLSPMKYGETHIWTGRELAWYPVKYKEKARKRWRAVISNNGFDSDKIAADDSTEVTRLAIWSWLKLAEYVNTRHTPLAELFAGDSQVGDSVAEPVKRDRIMMPGIELLTPEGKDEPEIRLRGDNLRQCNTCYLKDRGCKGYQPNAECVYEMPIEIRTIDQYRALENALIKMQTDRVMFMKMAEDLEGGFPDPNLSTEIDRLTKMIKLQREGQAEKFNLSISAQRPSQAGMLTALLGSETADKINAIDKPQPVDKLIQESLMGEVLESEVIPNAKGTQDQANRDNIRDNDGPRPVKQEDREQHGS